MSILMHGAPRDVATMWSSESATRMRHNWALSVLLEFECYTLLYWNRTEVDGGHRFLTSQRR